MATASIVARPPAVRLIDNDLVLLAQEIADDEGIGFRAALIIAEQTRPELTAYAQAWDQQGHASAPVTWIFNRDTGRVDIVQDGRVLETVALADTPQRLAYHRHQVALASGRTFVEKAAIKYQGRR